MTNEKLKAAKKIEAGCLTFALFLLGLAMALCLSSTNGSSLYFYGGLTLLFIGGASLIPCFEQHRVVKELEKEALSEGKKLEQSNQIPERQSTIRTGIMEAANSLPSFVPRDLCVSAKQVEAELQKLEEIIKSDASQATSLPCLLNRQEMDNSVKYWIFKCNPEYYRLDERLNDPEPNSTWRVTRYKDEIKEGDIAFIWLVGNKRVRGIRAIVRIDSLPADMDEIETEKSYYVKLDFARINRVKITFLERSPLVSAETLKNIPSLSNLSVFHGVQQPTNHKVSHEEGEFLVQYIKSHKNA